MRSIRQTAGFSLIELMVAVAISSFLLIGLVQIFSSIKVSYDLQAALARLQENSRFAGSFMARHMREAGRFPFAEQESGLIDLGFAFPLVNGAIPEPFGNETTDGADGGSDRVEINIFTDRNCSDGLNSNLSPDGVPATWHKQIVFSHDITNNELEYTCRYGAPQQGVDPPAVITNQPLLDNVETLQFLYGEDLDGDASADLYSIADNVSAFGNVVAVRIGLILNSPELGSLPPDDQDIDVIGNTFGPTGLGHLRRPFVIDVTLRNQTF